jgi:hypothetical protein
VLVRVLGGPPLVVVQVLAAAGLVGADGLDVAVRVRADPDVLPGRRDHQRPDPLDHLGVLDHVAVSIEVAEPLAPAAPGQARLVGVAPS